MDRTAGAPRRGPPGLERESPVRDAHVQGQVFEPPACPGIGTARSPRHPAACYQDTAGRSRAGGACRARRWTTLALCRLAPRRPPARRIRGGRGAVSHRGLLGGRVPAARLCVPLTHGGSCQRVHRPDTGGRRGGGLRAARRTSHGRAGAGRGRGARRGVAGRQRRRGPRQKSIGRMRSRERALTSLAASSSKFLRLTAAASSRQRPDVLVEGAVEGLDALAPEHDAALSLTVGAAQAQVPLAFAVALPLHRIDEVAAAHRAAARGRHAGCGPVGGRGGLAGNGRRVFPGDRLPRGDGAAGCSRSGHGGSRRASTGVWNTMTSTCVPSGKMKSSRRSSPSVLMPTSLLPRRRRRVPRSLYRTGAPSWLSACVARPGAGRRAREAAVWTVARGVGDTTGAPPGERS